MTDQDVMHTDVATEPPSEAGDARPDGGRRARQDPLFQVRASDVEPYTGLGYLSKLFRIIAVLLVVLIVVEAGTGLYNAGREALPTLLSEASRLIVLAGLLWGVGDLANLLIDVGHDVRATRILIGRQTTIQMGEAADARERLPREPRASGIGGERAALRDLDDRTA